MVPHFAQKTVSKLDTFYFYPPPGGRSQGKFDFDYPADDPDAGLFCIVDLGLVFRICGLRH